MRKGEESDGELDDDDTITERRKSEVKSRRLEKSSMEEKVEKIIKKAKSKGLKDRKGGEIWNNLLKVIKYAISFF